MNKLLNLSVKPHHLEVFVANVNSPVIFMMVKPNDYSIASLGRTPRSLSIPAKEVRGGQMVQFLHRPC